jgi:hypothetical protein
MNDSRSLIKYSVRSSDRLWLALQDQHPEHQYMIESRPTASRSVRARHRPFQIAAEQLEIHQ